VKVRTDEDVIPRWLQKRFGLMNQEMVLPNGTSIRYRQLRIPCCGSCNNRHLSKIERAVRLAFDKGPEAVAALDEQILFLWLGKIFYGLLYKDLFLRMDRKRPRKGPILPRRILDEYRMHYFFLQAIRQPFRFEPAIPASIVVFKLQAPDDPALQFEFRDSLALMTVSLRAGTVGILGALQDGRAQRDTLSRWFRMHQGRALHPLQFRELTARFFCRTSLLNRTPKFVSGAGPKEVVVIQSPLQGFSLKPIFDPWDHARYARLLAHMLDVPIDQIFRPPDQVMTWLLDEKGRLKHLDLAQTPFVD
jgi:hypothetical protein